MSNVRFASLYTWELRRVLRSTLLWLLLALIAAAFTWGAQSTARMHSSQTAALERLALAEMNATAQWQEQASRSAVPSSQPLPYWQDATDVSGFSQYYLLRHSFKPHLPASVLAVGVSDLRPSYQRVRLTTPFAQDASYEFHSPRALTFGSFDLSFAIVCLLPIAIILGFVLPVTFERDRDVMRLVAAQSVTPRQWLHARMLAILSLLLSGTCLALLSALAIAGVSFAQAAPEIVAAVGIVVAYVLLWVAIIYCVLTRWPHGWTAVGTLVTIWALLVIALPLLVGRIVSESLPSLAADEVDVRRRLDQEIEARESEIIRAAFKASSVLASRLDRIESIDYATQLSFLTPEIERRLEGRHREAAQQSERIARTSRWLSYVLPPLGVQMSLTHLAGTDLERHRAFEAQTRQFQLELRDMFYTLMHAQIAEPTPRPFADSYGRFTFTQYEQIPSFRPAAEDTPERVRNVIPLIITLLGVSALIAVLAGRRLRDWPEDL